MMKIMIMLVILIYNVTGDDDCDGGCVEVDGDHRAAESPSVLSQSPTVL